jgi:alkanesulfonate monooxygenase SsuD/methylene tetrahydromethanopterin reductase-like flavin-dependent oxidoreductase (luciferase family)
MTDLSKVSFGVVGALDRAMLRELAPRIEAAGFHGLWLNDTPDGDSLEGLAVAAEVTSTLKLATGVIPLDRRPAPVIAEAIRSLQLPEDRLVIGIGTGSPKEGLRRVTEAIEELRGATSAAVVVGALGPKIRKLGAELADGLLLSWLTPGAAADAMADLRRDQNAADRSGVKGILYTRTAVAPEGLRAMVAESARYQSYPSYAANFERIGAKAMDTTIYEKEADRLEYRIGEYTKSVDEIVLRAITGSESLDAYLRIVDLAANAG